MKSFKHTGNGPKYGSFTFSSKAGFGPSSGSVKNVSGYTRRAPKRVMKKALGGLAKNDVVRTPGGPADFAHGGPAQNPPKAGGYLSAAFSRNPKIGK